MGRRQPAFTLVELLVVISVVSLLISLVLPAIKQAKGVAKLSICLSNEKQLACVVLSYVVDNRSYFPVPPLGKYFSKGNDMAYWYMGTVIGGDDIGVWAQMIDVPARARPLATYVDPNSMLWRCPGDDGPIHWFYEHPAWDAGMSSYFFNAMPQTGKPGFYNKTIDDVPQPELFVLVGDWSKGWHGRDSYRCAGFADGHAKHMRTSILMEP